MVRNLLGIIILVLAFLASIELVRYFDICKLATCCN